VLVLVAPSFRFLPFLLLCGGDFTNVLTCVVFLVNQLGGSKASPAAPCGVALQSDLFVCFLFV